MNCEVFRNMLAAYLDETLEDDRRDWFRTHLARCDSCRDWAVGEEPSLLFAAAVPPDADPEQVEWCVTSVTSQIRQQRLARRLHGRRRPWLAAAAAAVVVVGSGIVWRAMPEGGGPTPDSAAGTGIAGEASHTPPSVEVEMTDEDVRVYQFAADDGDTAVYFVVNPSMEL